VGLWLWYSAQLSVGAFALSFVEGLRHGVTVVVIISPAAAAASALHQVAGQFFTVLEVSGARPHAVIGWIIVHAITQKKMTSENISTALSASIAVFMLCPVVVAPVGAGGWLGGHPLVCFHVDPLVGFDVGDFTRANKITQVRLKLTDHSFDSLLVCFFFLVCHVVVLWLLRAPCFALSL